MLFIEHRRDGMHLSIAYHWFMIVIIVEMSIVDSMAFEVQSALNPLLSFKIEECEIVK